MGETVGMIHPEIKFFLSCEPVKPGVLCISKIQWWDRYKIDIPISEGKIKREENVMYLR